MALAPALQVLTWPFLALTAWMLGRGWYLEIAGRRRRATVWRVRSRKVLVFSTVLAVTLWGLRFAGLLGPAPF